MSEAIAIEDLHKSYRHRLKSPAVPALRGVTLTVEAGEAFGFIGANGAGKSTAIKILMGLIAANAGSARIFDVPVDDPRARLGLGYVPENPYLYDYLTPSEILLMGVRLHRLRLDRPAEHCRQWLDRLGLAAVADKPIRSFSKGMTQRVAIAQALCIRPRLLVLDEPLSGLDPIGRRDVVEILSEYKRSGGTLFFTSHVLHDVERLADRAPAELTGDEEMVQVRSYGRLPVDGMREDFSGRWIGEVPRPQLWQRLEALRQAEHLLLEVRPTLSLEVAFMHAVGES